MTDALDRIEVRMAQQCSPEAFAALVKIARIAATMEHDSKSFNPLFGDCAPNCRRCQIDKLLEALK